MSRSVFRFYNPPASKTAQRDAAQARNARVKLKAERNARMRSWIMLLRQPAETGLGDTTERFRKLAEQRGKKQLAADLQALLHVCGCQPQDAITKLNEKHPYA